MSNYWFSWNHRKSMGEFEYHGPWWCSGVGEGFETMCAAVQGVAGEEEAAEKIRQAYESPPAELDVRFCEARPDDWKPFSGRFPRAEWMRWTP